MSFIIPLLLIICVSNTSVIILKRRFEEVLPLSLMASTLVVYLSGLFNQLIIGYYFVLLFAISFPVIITFLGIQKKNIKYLWNQIFTPGFFVFLLIYSFVFILNYNRGITSTFDEFAHWGPMVKETLRLNKFYSVPESVSWIHKDYPPIIPLFESMWCKMCGGYSEAYLYRSLQTLSLSLFLPALSNIPWRKNFSFFIKLILYTISMLSAVIIVPGLVFYQSFLIDSLLGLMLAYCISIIFYNNDFSDFFLLRFSVSLSFLILIKQIAIAFYLLTLVIFLANYFIINRYKTTESYKWKFTDKKTIFKVVKYIIALTTPYLFFISWNKYLSFYKISGQFNTSLIKITQLLGIAKGSSGESWQHEAFRNFIKSILTENLMFRPVSFSYWQIVLIGIIIFWLISKYGKKYYIKYQIASLNFFICVGAIGYAVAMLLLYVFCFGSYEGPRLADFERYIRTYLLAIFSLAMMLFLSIEGKKVKETNNTSNLDLAITILFIWLVLMSPTDILNFKPSINYHSVTEVYNKDANLIKEKTKSTDKVFIISQNDNVSVTFSIKYLIMPQECNYFDYSLGTNNDNNRFVWDLSPVQLANELATNNYHYLYLKKIDKYFISTFSNMFKSKNEIKENQLYKIEKSDNGSISFYLIG